MAENKSEEIERRGSESSGPGFGLVVYPSEIVKIKTGVFTRVLYRTEYFCGQVSDSLRKSIEVELDQGLAFKLIPVFLGLGIALYFSVPEEPSTRALIIAVVSGFVLLLRQNSRNGLSLLLGALLLLSTGMLSAKFATERTISPHLTTMITSEVVGVVLNVDHNRRGAPRYLIKPFSIEKLAANELPERLRLCAAGKGTRFEPGTVISGLARVQPVLGPVFVGGYDFSFFARFEKLGGSGFFMGPPSKIESKFSPELGFRETLIVWINSTRFNISDRIQRSLPGATGKIATALVVGDKTGIPQNIQEALRATGLAHILAISGLHMALVTLTVIWIVRIGLAVKTDVLVTRPVKKWAAAAGLAFASLYLLLSGAGVATQRAWIMICVMLFAIF